MIPRFSDHAANERTFLAWVRTAIAVMAFGFMIERFDLFLAASGPSARTAARLHLHLRTTEWVGLALIFVGALVIVLATVRFFDNRRDIRDQDCQSYTQARGAKLLAAILVVLGVFLSIYVGIELAALG